MLKRLSDIGEFALIQHLMGSGQTWLSGNILGPGDDCAVVPISAFNGVGRELDSLLVTVDTLLENVHFSTNFSSPEDIGWKILAVSISDIAAMGGVAQYATIGISLNGETEVEWIERVYAGLRQVATEYSVSILGGDTVSGLERSFCVSLIGVSECPPLLRSGAKVGDELWVSGFVGSAFLGLSLLQGDDEVAVIASSLQDDLLKSHRRPRPRLELGKALQQEGLASACIDISDGLIQDAGHLAAMSKRVLEIDLEKVPLTIDLPRDSRLVAGCLGGGDDYELLFTAKPEDSDRIEELSQVLDCSLTRIGLVQDSDQSPSVYLRTKGNKRVLAPDYLSEFLVSPGFQHFSR